MRRLLGIGITSALLAVPATATAGSVTVEQQGGRNVRVFVPTKPASPTALVVMLHGCTQTPEAFADATRMDEVAEKEGFVVAYPEQPSSVIATRCFQWYEPAHQARDAGEPKELADAASAIAQTRGVDPERIYVAGISAGAAMSVVLAATYPDRFTAIGVIAGVEYKAGTSFASAFSAAQSGGPDPVMQGALAHAQMGTRARAVPTFVLHGTSDGVLAKVNGDQVTAQWLHTNTLVLGEGAIEPVKTVTGSTGYPFTRMLHRNKANGASVIEYYVVDGLGHAWPGGRDGGSYSDPRGPDASGLLWAFFKGRTKSKPLDVPAAVLPELSGDPNGPGADPPQTTSESPGSPASPSGDSASSAGCNTSRAVPRPSSHPSALGLGLGLLALASLFARHRR